MGIKFLKVQMQILYEMGNQTMQELLKNFNTIRNNSLMDGNTQEFKNSKGNSIPPIWTVTFITQNTKCIDHGDAVWGACIKLKSLANVD